MPQLSANGFIKENSFFVPSKYKFENYFKLYTDKTTRTCRYIVLDPAYNINIEDISFDPVKFFSDTLLQKLRDNKISLIFNCAGEGSHLKFPYYNIFQRGFLSNNLPLDNFYYLTGDAAEQTIYAKENIYHINILDSLMNNRVVPNNYFITSYFTCLSRKPRYWRSRLIYEMSLTNYKDKMLSSHPKVESKSDFMNHDGFDVEDNIARFFIKNSPMQVSTISPLSDTMPFNHVISTLPEVYSKVAFDVALETYQEGEHEYITEKTFKPMLNSLPILIWGTPGINTTGLRRLGFKTYEDWFDLSFDSEIDTEKRLKLLVNEIIRICDRLDRTDDIRKWQKLNTHVIEHNKNLILKLLPTNKLEMNRLYSDLERT